MSVGNHLKLHSPGIEVENRTVFFVDACHVAVAAGESLGIALFDRDFDQFRRICSLEHVKRRG